ncbi:MAG TPA: hypothetical protein VMT76_10990 [Puia sp.]|nr:hypothetical protein [Puia sp.]
MKNKKLLLLAFLTTLSYFACKKNEVSDPGTANLSAAKTASIQRGEPVVFRYNTTSPDSVSWTVSPSDSVVIRSYGDSASIIFKNSGKYQVKASAGSGSSTIGVTVDTVFYNDSSRYPIDSINHSNDTASLVPLTGDQISITPSLLDSINNSGIVFSLVSTNKYNCLNNYLSVDVSVSGVNDNININGVYTPAPSACESGTKQSIGYAYIYPVADGTYSLNIKLNGTTYSGSYTKNGKSVKFTWKYSSGVTISPQTIN